MSDDWMKDTIKPKSDQLNADDLLTGPITVQVVKVERGNAEQPVTIQIEGRQPYKPCKSMRRVLVQAWSEFPDKWIGRTMTLYCDPSVMFGGVRVGGIRISHMSDIDRDREFSLTQTRGKKALHRVQRLDQKPAGGVTAEDLTTLSQRLAEQIQDSADRQDWLRSQGISGPPGKLTSWTPKSYEAVMRAIDAMSGPREPGGEG